MAENLILMPDEFYDEALPFENASTLEEIFMELEEKNLAMIHAMQEKQQILESMKDKETLLHSNLSKDYDVHKKNKEEIVGKIADV